MATSLSQAMTGDEKKNLFLINSGFSSSISLKSYQNKAGLLRWYGTLECGDFHEKFNFLTIQDFKNVFDKCSKVLKDL